MIIKLPDFFNNPSLIDFGFIKIQYYAVSWLLSALFIYLFLKREASLRKAGLDNESIYDLVFIYGLIFGAMAGGRIGYMLFYNLDQFFYNPFSLFFIWEGGLSFHGGLIGVIISSFIFSKRKKLSFLFIADNICISMPIGLGLVRIGNFLNGELYGRFTNANWGFIFPTDPYQLPRHPSQLYESIGEGIILFLILKYISTKKVKKGVISSFFLIFYGLIRFIIEFYRQPDAHLGLVGLNVFSMGQILCLLMMIAGTLLFFYTRKLNENIY